MIKVINGDLFETHAEAICHQVNCQGVMGSGVALQVKQNYPHVYEVYKEFCKENKGDLLGKVLPVGCHGNSGNLTVYNLFAQDKYGYDGECYTSYEALEKCLDILETTLPENTKIAMPYLMGCHRGGGDWNVVYRMLEDTFKKRDVLLYKKGE